MSYAGYNDFIDAMKDIMKREGLYHHLSDENDIRCWVIQNKEKAIPRLGKLSFIECKLITNLYHQGYQYSKKQGCLNNEQLSELTKIHYERGFSLKDIDVRLLGVKYIQEHEDLLQYFKDHGTIDDIVSIFGELTLEDAKRFAVRQMQSDTLYKVLAYTDISTHPEIIKAYLEAHNFFYSLPEIFITDDVVDVIIDNSLKNPESYIPRPIFNYMNANHIKKLISVKPKVLVEFNDIERIFNDIYDQSKESFTLELSMLNNLLLKECNLTFKNEKVKEAILQGYMESLINIDSIYIAYNKFRKMKFLEEYE